MDPKKTPGRLEQSAGKVRGTARQTGIVPEAAVEDVEHQLLEAMGDGPAADPSPALAALRSLSEDKFDLPPVSEAPTLVDIIEKRIHPVIRAHLLQSAANALERDLPEEIVLACLLHDLGMAIHQPDHGYWGAQMIRPYVSEKVHWAVQYHQALRFYPDPSVGYEYPELYIQLFGADYKPEPYIQEAYKTARAHRWYMNSRLVTLMDEYSFDPNRLVSIDDFIDIIGRHFKTPPEGLGKDGSPVFHMWNTLIHPKSPL